MMKNDLNEKILWLSLFSDISEWSRLADKYAVKQVVRELIGNEYVVPNYGVWESFEQIDFTKYGKLNTTIDTLDKNMAKNQSISLNPTKINGICGRLLCCLNYEDDTYTELKKDYPSIGTRLKINDVEGKVVSLNVLNNKITLEKSDKTQVEVEYNKNESRK